MPLELLEVACFRIPLPRVLSDSTHGFMPDFQLITVRIRDQDGVEGLGYVYTIGSGGLAIRSLIDVDLRPLVEAADAHDIAAIWQQMWRRLHYVGRGGLASFAISAIDICLWDLRARRAGLPLWRQLGGTDNRVPVYAGGIDLRFTVDELLEQTDRFRMQGFQAIKIKVGQADLNDDVQRVAAMREKLGAEFPLMVDANMGWDVEQAITAARALHEFNLYWLEEPTAPDDFPAHARIATEGGIPIAAGENLHTEREFEMLLAAGGASFPEPDVANIGGITAWNRIAALAQRYDLPVTSHGVHDLHVHLLAAASNSSYLEWHGFGLERFMTQPLEIRDGFALAPDRPGHGVELDWDSLKPYRES